VQQLARLSGVNPFGPTVAEVPRESLDDPRPGGIDLEETVPRDPEKWLVATESACVSLLLEVIQPMSAVWPSVAGR
jgi:hypothetical protein